MNVGLLAKPLTPATRTKRLLNLLIDTVFFYIILVSIGVVAALIDPSIADSLERTNPLVDRLVSSVLFAGYYFGFENWLGKTPGKMITKTKVVDSEGEKPGFSSILKRSLARLIPFDAFTFLRETPIGMHDRMADTLVVDDRPRLSFDQSLRNMPD